MYIGPNEAKKKIALRKRASTSDESGRWNMNKR